jgi:hypothetical protein
MRPMAQLNRTLVHNMHGRRSAPPCSGAARESALTNLLATWGERTALSGI